MALKGGTGSITITENNGKQHIIKASDLDFDEMERHVRDGGNEVLHKADADYGTYSVTVEAWEFPEGHQSAETNIEVEGGVLTDGGFEFEFVLS